MDLLLTVVGVAKRGRISWRALFYSWHHVTPRGCWYLVKQDHQFLNKFLQIQQIQQNTFNHCLTQEKVFILSSDSVIYKRVVARKIRLTRRFSLFCLLNKLNKQANEISSRQTGWSTASSCFDLVWWCCRVILSGTAVDSTARVTPACPIYMFLTSNTGSRKYYLWKKMIVEK